MSSNAELSTCPGSAADSQGIIFDEELASALAILISTVIVPYFLIQEVEEMISIGLLKYIVSFWNWVDLSIVVVFLFGVLFNKVSQQQHTPQRPRVSG